MTVTSVIMTSDLRIARIYVSFINNSQSVDSLMEILKSKIKFFKYHISQKWHAKFMPDLEFYYDNSMRSAENLNRIMKEISE
jgi:ribosome-binding factor A